jgi:GH24 family phage-related lysozyme (muramidase)
MTLLSRTTNTPGDYSLEPEGRSPLLTKMYVGFVRETDDDSRMGRLRVWIPEISGGDGTDPSSWFIVSYCSPFAGATSVYNNKPNDQSYTASQRSYGMWFVPPDKDNEVIVAFINGDSSKGIWLGCLYQQNMNNMVPGIAGNGGTAGAPVVEYNKRNQYNGDPSETSQRPEFEPLRDGLLRQGLLNDPVRGITSASARRPDPINNAYGFLTPGGSQVVFDDDPSNSFIRLRTQQGAQVLVNDSTGCVYMNSVDGKNWVELSAGGEIDIYAQADISIRSQGSLNLRADLDVNIEAGRSIYMKARDEQAGPIPDIAIFLDPTNAGNLIIGQEQYTYYGNWQSSTTGQISNTSVVFTDGLVVEFRRDEDIAKNLISYAVSGVNKSIELTPTPTSATPSGGGVIKMEAVKEFHVYAQQNMYVSSLKQIHTSAGTDMLQTSFGNFSRRSNGYIRDFASGDFGILSSGGYTLQAPRVDINGPAPGVGGTAAVASTPIDLNQKDMQIITDGQFRYILINTIMPRLPYHEPYTGHSARVFGLNGSIEVGSNGGLRAGQIIPGQEKPLDIIGSPREGQPAGRYSGQGYDEKGNPIYKYEGGSGDLGAAASYRSSSSLIEFIKRHEGLKYSVYKDPVGLPTVGYGHLVTAQEQASNSVLIGGVNVPLSRPLTQTEVDTLLRQDLDTKAELYVRKFVKVPITQSQFDALTSFTFNLGGGRLQKSDILEQLNKGNYSEVPNLLLQYVYAKGKILRGLVTRREAEASWFRGKPVTGA